MSEHDETLQKALEENAKLRSEREELLRDTASSEYSGRLRIAERIYWVYSLICVALAVAAINFFARSYDVKTLIGSAVVILVLFETTVLMKLWFATASMKMSVLKDVKLLRLETMRLADAVGVEQPSQPPVRYEPMRGTSRMERGLWLAACVIVAMGVSSWTAHAWRLGGSGDIETRTVVTLAADGSAEKQTESIKSYSSYYRPSGFSNYAPKDWKVRFLDAAGEQLPVDVVPMGDQLRHDITFTDGVFVDGKMRYTMIAKIPNAASLEDGVWTYNDGFRYAGGKKDYRITIFPPDGAELVSAEPKPDVVEKDDEEGRMQIRYQGTAADDKQYKFTIRYKMPDEGQQP